MIFRAVLLFAVMTASACGGTYYVATTGNDSTGNGSASAPWKSILQATASIPDDGSTVMVLSGTYNGAQGVNRQFTHTTYISGAANYASVLYGGAGNRALEIYNGSNLMIESFDIKGPASAAANTEYVVQLSTATCHNITLSNCLIHDSGQDDLVKINSNASGITIQGCCLWNSNPNSAAEGIELIDIDVGQNVVLKSNIMFHNFPKGTTGGSGFVVCKDGASAAETCRGFVFSSNICYHWQGSSDESMLLLGEDSVPWPEDDGVDISDNLMISSPADAATWGPMMFKGGRNITVRNNTFLGHANIQGTGAAGCQMLLIPPNPAMFGVTFANNLYADNSGTMPDVFWSSTPGLFSTLPVLDNNLYWNGGKAVPVRATDALKYTQDPRAVLGNPNVANPVLTPSTWNGAQFTSGQTSVVGEFARLAVYGAVGTYYPGDVTAAPNLDILGNPRGTNTVGCLASMGGTTPPITPPPPVTPPPVPKPPVRHHHYWN